MYTLYKFTAILPWLCTKLYSLIVNWKYVERIGNSSIKIHPSTHLLMSNSRIIIENGTLRVGIDCGYTGGLCIDPRKDNCRIHLDNSTLRIIGDVGLFPGCRIWARGGEIAIGNGTILNPLSHIMARGRIEIGEQCLIASGVIIRDNDGHKLAIGDDKPTDILKNIVIKNHCWIGHNAIILKGVTIGEGAVVAAGSVVTKDVKERTLVAGVPAKTIQENVVWEA